MNGNQFQFFLSHSDEKIQQIALLRRKIGGSLLDIGCGEGTITLALKDMFDRVEVVEEKKNYCENLEKQGIVCHNTKFEDFQTSSRYDVILASHLLTYLDDKEKAIAKMYQLLKVGGKIYIFNMTYDGLMQVIKEKIHPDISNRTDLQVQEIVKKYVKYEREIIPINMETKTDEEMLGMIKFLSEKRPELWDKNKNNIRKIVKGTTQTGNGYTLGYFNVLYTIYKI